MLFQMLCRKEGKALKYKQNIEASNRKEVAGSDDNKSCLPERHELGVRDKCRGQAEAAGHK